MSLLPVAISAPVCRIWSRSSQQCLAILRGHAGRGIWRCLLSPQHAITAGADGSIKMWRLADHVPGLRASAEPAAQGTAEDSLMAQALALYGSTFQAYLASAQLCSILAGRAMVSQDAVLASRWCVCSCFLGAEAKGDRV